jgi:hypothetical protein
MSLQITAVVSRGKKKGTLLSPHRYQEGFYVISKGGNTVAFRREVSNLDDLPTWIAQGYGVRMSRASVAPSIYMPKSLVVRSCK